MLRRFCEEKFPVLYRSAAVETQPSSAGNAASVTAASAAPAASRKCHRRIQESTSSDEDEGKGKGEVEESGQESVSEVEEEG
eukprot:2375766-Pleurochrysis_carterae.AAC.1